MFFQVFCGNCCLGEISSKEVNAKTETFFLNSWIYEIKLIDTIV
jgi:hypothetical protein